MSAACCAAFALALALASSAAAVDQKSCPLPFGPGEHFVYRMEYIGLTVGSVEITLGSVAQRGGHRVLPIVARAQTESAFSIYPIHDQYISYLDLDTLGSTEDLLEGNEGRRHWRQRMRLDADAGKVLIHRDTQGKPPDDVTLPLAKGAVDVAGMFLAIRAQKFAPDSVFSFPVTTDTRGFTLKGAVAPAEDFDSELGPRKVYPTTLETSFSGKLETKKAMVALYTVDAAHVPVRAEAEFMLGTVVAKLVEYEPGTPLTGRCVGP